ncbi:hypothetical protein HOE425_330673 [Hoeflea sp. EC-HK425]|nr:hypothetical protein HOE425_330673 [Hoeflea sp. EC-HK425]
MPNEAWPFSPDVASAPARNLLSAAVERSDLADFDVSAMIVGGEKPWRRIRVERGTGEMAGVDRAGVDGDAVGVEFGKRGGGDGVAVDNGLGERPGETKEFLADPAGGHRILIGKGKIGVYAAVDEDVAVGFHHPVRRTQGCDMAGMSDGQLSDGAVHVVDVLKPVGAQGLVAPIHQPAVHYRFSVVGGIEEAEQKFLVIAEDQPRTGMRLERGNCQIEALPAFRAAIDEVAQEDDAKLAIARIRADGFEQGLQQVAPAVDIANGVGERHSGILAVVCGTDAGQGLVAASVPIV